jgi:hypothetical protein
MRLNISRQLFTTAFLFALFVLGLQSAPVSLRAQDARPAEDSTPENAAPATPSVDPASSGEQSPVGDSASPDATAEPADVLGNRQDQLAEKYQRLEMLILKMAEFNADTDPRRAALLKQALTRSKDRRIAPRMTEVAKLLESESWREAKTGQGEVRTDLAQLLELLLSENSADELKQEQERVKSYIKEVERILRQQRAVQGRTEGGDDPQRLAQDQGNIADRTGRLSGEIKENEGQADSAAPNEAEQGPAPSDNSEPGDSEPGDSEPGDSEPGDSEPGDSEPGDSEPGDSEREDGEGSSTENQGGEEQGEDSEETEKGSEPDESDTSDGSTEKPAGEPGSESQGENAEGQPSEGQPSEGQPSQGQPSEGQPSQGQPSQGQPSEGQPSPQDAPAQQEMFPGQSQIEQAEQKMREAQERLEKAERDEAIEPQQEARRLLEEAKAELEEILRQMREEEIERALAQLETRFRKMLEMQIKVYEDTKQLDELDSAERASQIVVQSGRLSAEEGKILAESDKALLLLREEGSSVAFPEAVEQMREDMEQVTERLREAKVDALTLSLESDIITALEEIVEALQKAQQEAEDRRNNPPPGNSQGGEMETPLVDAIAELKMIRALQMRVNKRTQTYANMLADPEHEVGQATDEDLIDSLSQLAEREERIREITRDIILEKNK